MAKTPIALEGLLKTQNPLTDTGIPQRGTPPARPVKRPGEKRLSLALDGETYRRLRIHAVQNDKTHQAILEEALSAYLDSAQA